ncbi:MAG: PaaI family thioesterase, partial [Chloroflexi bacterium]
MAARAEAGAREPRQLGPGARAHRAFDCALRSRRRRNCRGARARRACDRAGDGRPVQHRGGNGAAGPERRYRQCTRIDARSVRRCGGHLRGARRALGARRRALRARPAPGKARASRRRKARPARFDAHLRGARCTSARRLDVAGVGARPPAPRRTECCDPCRRSSRAHVVSVAPRPDADVPIWKEPPRGGYPDLRIFQLSGAEFDLAVRRGKFVRAPLFYLTGAWITHADEERTVWEQPASGWFLSSQGVVPGGFLAVIADMALGSIASRRVRQMFSTSEMSFNFVRTATEQSGTLIAEGRFVGSTGRLALSEATITDAQGAVIAHSTCRNVLTAGQPPGDAIASGDSGAVSAFLDSLPDAEPVDTTVPDPYLRPVVGEVLPRHVWENATGREILEGQIAGTIPMPPIHYLTGIRPTSVDKGSVEFSMPASAWLTSGFRSVLGGFIAFLGYSALASAVQTTTD